MNSRQQQMGDSGRHREGQPITKRLLLRPRSNSTTQTPSHDTEAQQQEFQNFKEEIKWSRQVAAHDQVDLRETQRELGAVLNRYSDLYDFAPVGYATLNRKGVLTHINVAGARLLGVDPARMGSIPFALLLTKESRADWLSTLSRLRRGLDQSEVSVVRAETNDGKRPVLRLQIIRARGGEPDAWLRVAILDITAEHRVQETAHHNEARFRALIENSDEIITVVDGTGKIIYESTNARAVLGYPAENLIGKSAFAMLHPDDVPRARRLFADSVATPNVTYQIEVRVQHRDRSWRWFEITGKNLLANPDVAGIVLNARDITERKAADAALRAKEAELTAAKQRLDAHMENSPLAIVEFDPEFRVIRWSQEAERMFGWKAVEMTGRAIAEIRWVHDDDLKPVRQAMQDMLNGKRPRNLTVNRNYRKDGQVVLCEWYNSALYDTQGRLTSILSQVLDITARKKAEDSLRVAHEKLEERVRERTMELIQSNAALHESEARLQAIMDHSPAMMFLKDPQGRYLHFNREFAEKFHLTFKEAIGRTDTDIFPAKIAAVFRANDRKVLETGAPMQFDEVAHYEDGLHTSIVTKFPLRDSDGNIYAIAGIVTDITERKRLEAEVLHASEREQRRIAQDLHDSLGQQLAGIQFMSRALQQKLAEKSLVEEAAAGQIAELVHEATNQAHDLAKGLAPVEARPEALNPALRRLAMGTEKVFGVSCKFSGEERVLLHDPAKANHLYRIAQEAISNAIKHGEATEVTVQLKKVGGRIKLAIKDNGRGFSPPKRSKKGMGLNIMRHRAGVAGGSLVVRQRRSGGTAVICQLEKEPSQRAKKRGGK